MSQTFDDMICFDVYAANLAIGRLYKPLMDALGLTYPQYLVLMVLWEQGPQTIGALGSIMGLESSTLTPLVKRMEAAGIVTRARDAVDERKVFVSLTEKGAALEAERDRISACVFEATGLTVDELREMQRLLRRARASVTAETGK